MSAKRASEVRKGDLLVFRASNGTTLARVTGSEAWDDPEDGRTMLGIHVTLGRAVSLPEIGWRTNYWTLWHFPDEVLELYDKSELRRVR